MDEKISSNIKYPYHVETKLQVGIFIIITACSIATRLYNIETPDHVCWDETHFGKMGSYYINRTFFFDVHPPLGKMLVGLSGLLTGYNGSFAFDKPGDKYGTTPYLGMRVYSALLGSTLAPLCYGIMWELTHSIAGAILAGILVICDVGMVTLTQYILLDPPLLAFIMAATYCYLKFSATSEDFSTTWWLWMFLTGFFLACAISVKFVGLFVILLVGFSTIADLWSKLGDLKNTIRKILTHFIARTVGLILWPAFIYIVFFYIHLRLLNKSGTGDGFMSSSFQAQLKGNPLYNASMPEGIAYGSVVTIKNHRTGGGYLHSHWHLYPDGIGAKQQQVTTYSHKDENNQWQMKRFDVNPDPLKDSLQLVRHGDLVRLEHVVTRRNLHSHREMAPLTRRHYQVTAYGFNGSGDSNDVFRVQIDGASEATPLRTLRSSFRLFHVQLGCAVHSHSKQLPKWGWDQLEVTCNPLVRDKKNLWNVEEVIDARLPNTSFDMYAPTFLENFLELHAVMFQGNSGLKPKEGEVTSRPWQWPINYRGQPFSGGDLRVYLLGNPVIWWLNLITMMIFCIMFVSVKCAEQRGVDVEQYLHAFSGETLRAGKWLFGAWVLHYLPFWFMGRILYFHHYFPAALYSTMLCAVVLDFVVFRLGCFIGSHQDTCIHAIIVCLVAGFVYSFVRFSPLSYGMPETDSETQNRTGASWKHLKWMDSWDI